MHPSTHFARHVAVSLLALAASSVFAQAPSAVANKEAYNLNLRSQIATIYREKASRPPALRKMSMDLVYAVRMMKGEDVKKGLPKLHVPNVARLDGTVDVEFKAAVTPALLSRLKSLGTEVRSSYVRFGSINGRIPLRNLEAAVMLPGVRCVGTMGKFMVNSGNYQSEGDKSIGANLLRTDYGLTGNGVKVGIMSDSNDNQEASQTSGDLPASIDVPNGNDGRPNTGEGTAMMEIVHDVAPNASLAFNTGYASEADFAQHYLDLFNDGCFIIADDLEYYAEPAFQDGPIAQAMNQIFDSGGICFAAAGNSGSLRSGTSSVWEGDFTDSGFNFTYGDGTVAPANAWSSGQAANQITNVGLKDLSLQWNDPWNNCTNDYDLFLTDASGNVVVSADANNIGGTPIEETSNDTASRYAYVVRYSGVNRVVRLNQARGVLQYGTNGQIYGHPASAYGFGIAAINAALSPQRAFNAADQTTYYSSDGPRRVYYNDDGSQLSTNLTYAGAYVRQQPALTAADGVATNAPGFARFYGTSAASPHVAALSALLKEFDPNANPFRILFALTAGVVDIGTAGWDVNGGSGAVNGLGSIKFLQETSTFGVSPGSVTISPTSSSTLTLNIGLNAPPSGINVVVSATGDTSLVSYPPTFAVPAGSHTRLFAVNGTGGTGAGSVALTFKDKYSGAVLGTRTISRIASEKVASVTFSPASLTGGGSSVGTVTLDHAAINAVTINVASSNSAAASVPSTVTVSAGQTTKTFSIATTPVATDKTVTISAIRSGVESSAHTATLTVKAPRVTSIVPRPSSVFPGNTIGFYVYLSGPAPSGGYSTALSSSDSTVLPMPHSTTFAQGSSSAIFRVVVGSSSTAKNVSVIARYGRVETARAVVNVIVPEVASLTITPNSVHGGASTTGKVTLASAAKPGGTLVTLSGYVSGVTSGPATLLIPAGSGSATFTIATGATRTSHRTAISAKTTATARSATLVVSP